MYICIPVYTCISVTTLFYSIGHIIHDNISPCLKWIMFSKEQFFPSLIRSKNFELPNTYICIRDTNTHTRGGEIGEEKRSQNITV